MYFITFVPPHDIYNYSLYVLYLLCECLQPPAT